MFVRGRVNPLFFVAFALVMLMTGCPRTLPPEGPKTPVGRVPTRDLTAQPRPTRAISLETPVAGPTWVPAPIPLPTLGPDGLAGPLNETATRWTFSVPSAPTLLGWPATRLINEQMLTALWETDVLLRWTHASPPGSNWYQVWTAVDAPYFEPGNCAGCGLEGVTSAQRFVSDAEGLTFSPTHGLAQSDVMGRVQTYQVLACNRAGCSAPSNEMGVIVYSLDQGIPDLPYR